MIDTYNAKKVHKRGENKKAIVHIVQAINIDVIDKNVSKKERTAIRYYTSETVPSNTHIGIQSPRAHKR